MMSAFEIISMILTLCQTQSVQSIAMFHNHKCFAFAKSGGGGGYVPQLGRQQRRHGAKSVGLARTQAPQTGLPKAQGACHTLRGAHPVRLTLDPSLPQASAVHSLRAPNPRPFPSRRRWQIVCRD